jgi:DNA (cytosine-5)-methyltransferase 3A
MKKEYLDIISEQMGVEPIMINSALVSAQNRVRYYWTNIPGIEQPKQRGIVLRDILETREIDGLSDKAIAYMNRSSDKWSGGKTRKDIYIKDQDEKSNCLTANMHKGVPYGVIAVNKPIQVGIATDINGHDILKRVYSPDGKSPTVNACTGGNREPKVKVDVRAMTEVRTPEANQIRYEHKRKTGKDWSPRHMRHLVERDDEKMNTLTGALTKQHILQITRDPEQEVYWRKLTPVECERLQTVPDNYTNHVSNTQRYKMLGNGWTIEVITHILNNLHE